jgi:hypothetical protein
VSGSLPDCDFGKAMTSRIASLPAGTITRRSTRPIPPWGGAPSVCAQQMPELSSTSAAGSRRASNLPLGRGVVDADAPPRPQAVQHEVVRASLRGLRPGRPMRVT